jgi:glycosyltransferase involved in cell wall biosynthesis
MTETADVCLLIEGGYPYVLGGVASWTDTLIRSLPGLRFHIVAFIISRQDRTIRYALPPNVLGVTDVLLDDATPGRFFSRAGLERIDRLIKQCRTILMADDGTEFSLLMRELEQSGLGCRALLDTRRAWACMEQAYEIMLPNAPMIDFFWTWRFLVRSLIAISAAPLPKAQVYHAISTGYAGLFGARAKGATGRPLLLTEHGIYTNERRIEISVADWIYDSGAGGFGVSTRAPELRDVWQSAFASFSRIAYNSADVITTQYRANQLLQLQDGAPEHKLRIIPNGIDVEKIAKVPPEMGARRPRVLLVGRIVPIKDIRTFILAAAILRDFVPDVEAMIIGPDDEDPIYAAECKALVKSHGLEDVVKLLGRVGSIYEYFSRCDVVALTSISEAQPLVILEAGAAGLPVIVTDVGSCREIVEGDPNDPTSEAGGFVVPACDPQAVAESAAKLLLDPELRLRMGRTLQARIRSKYDQKRVRQMYESLYLSCFDARTSAKAS